LGLGAVEVLERDRFKRNHPKRGSRVKTKS
jgi:hypothetical protein